MTIPSSIFLIPLLLLSLVQPAVSASDPTSPSSTTKASSTFWPTTTSSATLPTTTSSTFWPTRTSSATRPTTTSSTPWPTTTSSATLPTTTSSTFWPTTTSSTFWPTTTSSTPWPTTTSSATLPTTASSTFWPTRTSSATRPTTTSSTPWPTTTETTTMTREPTTITTSSSEITSSYSNSLQSDSPKFARPYRPGDTNYFYQAILLTISKAATYSFSSNSSISIFGCLYSSSFDPSNPMTNLLGCSDNIESGMKYLLSHYLDTTTSFSLIVTTSYSMVIGSYTIQVVGPESIKMTTVPPPPPNPHTWIIYEVLGLIAAVSVIVVGMVLICLRRRRLQRRRRERLLPTDHRQNRNDENIPPADTLINATHCNENIVPSAPRQDTTFRGFSEEGRLPSYDTVMDNRGPFEYPRP